MNSIPQVAGAIEMILTKRAEELAHESGFVQRRSPLTGAIFSQMCVFGWMALPQASYPQLRQVAASLGAHVSQQAIEQRFGATSTALLRSVLTEALSYV